MVDDAASDDISGGGGDSIRETDASPELERLRAENDELRRQLDAKPDPTAEEPAKVRHMRRRWASVVCAILAGIILPASIITVWARGTMLDTDEYVTTISPLVDDADIQEAVTFRVTEAVSEALDLKSVAEEVLPKEAAVLAGPISSGAENLISDTVNEVVSSPEFSALWADAHRLAHDALVLLVTGEGGGDAISNEDGRVVLRVAPVVQEVLDRIEAQLGTDLVKNIPVDKIDAEVVIIDSAELRDIQGAVRVFDTVSWILPFLALLLLAGAVFLAEQRRLGVRRLGIAVVVSMLLGILAYGLTRDAYLGALPDDVHNPDAAAAIFDILTRFLQRSFRTILVIGLLLLIGVWVVGPSTYAGKVRTAWDSLLGRASAAGEERETVVVVAAVAAHRRALQLATVAIGATVLVLWTHPTGMVVVSIVVLTAFVAGIIRVVAEADESTERDDSAGAGPSDDVATDNMEQDGADKGDVPEHSR